jgi:SAM-dependent methyltransferase
MMIPPKHRLCGAKADWVRFRVEKLSQIKQSSPVMNEHRFTAATADPLDLYERSVQDTAITIGLIDEIYRAQHGRLALTLREDFCGTAVLCADWVISHPARAAVGLDIDRPTLEWARTHNVPRAADADGRLRLIERDVLAGTTDETFDVVAALNFSYFTFHDRRTLVDYFRSVRTALDDGGFLLLDLHGGPDSQFKLEETTDYDEFDYVWEQEVFDPINNKAICHIHYRFPDGSELRNAFTYDWRVWSIPELRDALTEAGYSGVDVWWEGHEDDDPRPATSAENLEAWVAYLAAWR